MTPRRQGRWIALLPIALAIAVLTIVFLLESLFEDGLSREIAGELSSLQTASTFDSVIGAIELLERREAEPSDDRFGRYLVLDPENQARIAGNLDNWPDGFPMPPEGSAASSPAIARQGTLVGGSVLLEGHFPVFVGRSMEEFVYLRNLMLASVAALVLLFIVTRAIFAHRQSQQVEGRLARIEEILKAFSRGERQLRIHDEGEDVLGKIAGEVDALLDLLSRRMENYETIAEQIVHELRSPVARRLVSAKDVDSPEARSAREVLQTIDRVVTLAELSRQPLSTQLLWLDELVREMLALYGDAAEEANLSLVHELDPSRLVADPTLVRRLIANLLDNAIRYSNEGGDIRIETYMSTKEAVFSISDSGPGLKGLPPEPGMMLNRGPAGDIAHGWGIGLALCMRIVQRHGGAISFADRTDRTGLTVHVSLPLPSGHLH